MPFNGKLKTVIESCKPVIVLVPLVHVLKAERALVKWGMGWTMSRLQCEEAAAAASQLAGLIG